MATDSRAPPDSRPLAEPRTESPALPGWGMHNQYSRGLRWALWCVIGGLALYLAYVLRLPGADWLQERSGVWAAGWTALLGGAVPLVIAWIARQRKRSA